MMPYFNFHKTYLLIQDPSDRFKFLSSKWVALNLQLALRFQELLTPLGGFPIEIETQISLIIKYSLAIFIA